MTVWPVEAVAFWCSPGKDIPADTFKPVQIAVFAETHARAVVMIRVLGEWFARRYE